MLAALVVCLALVALPGALAAQPASGDAPGDRGADAPSDPPASTDPTFERAQELFNAGRLLFNQGRFEQACHKFEQSLALVAGVGTRGKLAECWERIGRLASAHRLYLEVERLARERGQAGRAEIAGERARRLEPRLPYLIIDPGPSVIAGGFHIARNGLPVEPRVFKTAVAVDPGEYVITAAARKHAGWKTEVRIAIGERKRVVVPALLPQGTEPETVDTAGPATGGFWTGGRIAGIGLIGAGAASLFGGTTFFALRASDRWSDAKETTECQPIEGALECVPGTEGDRLARSANSNANLANLTAVAGTVVIVGGVVVLWRSWGNPGASPSETGLRITPSVSPSSAGIALWRRF